VTDDAPEDRRRLGGVGAGAGAIRGRSRDRRRPDPAGPGAGGAAGEREPSAEERVMHALELAYRHLSKRDRTEAEVRHHLERRRIGRPSVERALAELRELGYVDDARYARRYVEDRRSIDAWGPLRIAAGLRRLGVSDALIDEALARPDEQTDAERALGVLRARLGGSPLDDDRARGRALRMLAGRGFALEVSYDAVRAYERGEDR